MALNMYSGHKSCEYYCVGYQTKQFIIKKVLHITDVLVAVQLYVRSNINCMQWLWG